MSTIEERWVNPTSKCDLCGRARPKDEIWTEEHVTMGCSGFNFTWCPDCEKKGKATGNIISDCLSNWKKQCEEYWKNHDKTRS